MKLKIVSDGTVHGTKVLDEHGNMLVGVVSINWEVDKDSDFGKATIGVIDVPLECVGDGEVYIDCND
jgi:hypothetical protein